jgi:hypothetical protein
MRPIPASGPAGKMEPWNACRSVAANRWFRRATDRFGNADYAIVKRASLGELKGAGLLVAIPFLELCEANLASADMGDVQ